MSLSQIIFGSPNNQVPQSNASQPVIIADPVSNAIGSTFGEYSNSYARLQVLGGSSLEPITTESLDGIENNDSTGEASSVIDYIVIQNSAETFVERMAPTYTFGQSLLFTSGSDAKNFVYTGFVLITKSDGDGRARLERLYNDVLRATALVDNPDGSRLVRLTYRDQVREGYLTSLNIQVESIVEARVPINFSMFVTNQY